MPTFHVLIFANPVEGQDEAFADWYENTHLDEVLATAAPNPLTHTRHDL